MAVAHPMPSRGHRMSDATPRDHSFLRSSGGPRPGSIYAIVGPDGAGKTTIAMDMVSRLLRRGIRTRISWMRSPRIVTLAVIGVLRLAGLAKKHGGLLVTASPEELVRRKPILSLDPRLPRRLRLYHEFARRFGLGTIDSGNTPESVSFAQAAEYFGLSDD